jgi:hypothetical protein
MRALIKDSAQEAIIRLLAEVRAGVAPKRRPNRRGPLRSGQALRRNGRRSEHRLCPSRTGHSVSVAFRIIQLGNLALQNSHLLAPLASDALGESWRSQPFERGGQLLTLLRNRLLGFPRACVVPRTAYAASHYRGSNPGT